MFAKGGVYGGVVYAPSITLTNHIFENNSIVSKTGTVYDCGITMDTATTTDPMTLTTAATSGHEAVFKNNTTQNINGERTNSILIKPAQIDYGIMWAASKADAILAINPKGSSTISLLDPIYVEQKMGKAFTMNVNQEGMFYWGGNNKFKVDAVNEKNNEKNAVNLGTYTQTQLMNNFNLDAPNHDFI